MRIAKPISLIMPSKLHESLNNYLENHEVGYNYKPEYFYFTVDHLLFLENLNKKASFVPIDLKKLKCLSVSNIDRYIKLLLNGEFIISDKIYKPGIKSLWYKVNPKLKEGCKEIELIPTSRLYKKLIAEVNKERSHDHRLKPHLKAMKKKFFDLEIDYLEAEKFILDKVEPRLQANYLSTIKRFEHKKLRYFSRNVTNKRLDTNLTNLSKRLKKFLGPKLFSIDLVNSQPLLLSILIDNIINYQHITLCSYFLKKEIVKAFGKRAFDKVLLIHQKHTKTTKNSNKANLKTFQEQVQAGTFYDHFAKAYGRINRNDAKGIIFKVLFSKNKIYVKGVKKIPFEKEKKIFTEVYPEVAEIVTVLKEKDYKILSIYLQKIESFIFIDCIAKELFQEGIIPLTIHDSVLIEPIHLQKAKNTLERVFKEQTGITPKFHIQKVN